MELARRIYEVSQTMPKEEQFGLTSQLRRAAISIPSNIAEGFGRERRRDLLQFLRIARGSLNELSTQYELAVELQMIEAKPAMIELINETDRVLQGLISSLQRLETQ
ncbi:MAG: four helix bundle protein [Planctomycetota bacterium]|nr:four helix bundle protein [Planctomycetota bacterium]